MNGADRIARERGRQIEVEGWSAERDDAYIKGELAQAAYCYALPTEIRRIGDMDFPLDLWPEGWDRSWWKPGDGSVMGRVRELEKAGALLAAEIDRLLRLAGTPDCADYDPTPWCSYGHKTEADCDCGPIADNE
jgi:hypothetical protein